MIKIYNSLNRKKEFFEPINPPKVTMYACGLTPQNHPHLGHAVAAIRFSIIRRYLEHKGYNVVFVENATDIDDKIINRSKELNITPNEVAEKYLAEYRKALMSLELPKPTHYPRVTQYIDKIIDYVSVLIEKGFAYSTPEGDVYFDVNKKDDYGKLSGRVIDKLISGTRVKVKNNKRSPVDFALWKKDLTTGASWNSPWGKGRPGWHIECSVMSNDLLGESIDIHCGGLDLIFPHHENEIAQCEAHNGVDFSKYWVHCGLLVIEGKKMSKSLGNFFTINDSLNKYGKELISFVILRHHYRSPIDFNDQLFRENLNLLCDFYRCFNPDSLREKEIFYAETEDTVNLVQKFEEAMNDDFNTPTALVVLSSFLDKAKKYKNKGEENKGESILKCIIKLGRIIGLFSPAYNLDRIEVETLLFHQLSLNLKKPLTLSELNELIIERKNARKEKNYKKSDEIRDKLNLNRIKIMDGVKASHDWQFITVV